MDWLWLWCEELAQEYKEEGKGKLHLEQLIQEARDAVESLTQAHRHIIFSNLHTKHALSTLLCSPDYVLFRSLLLKIFLS